MKQVIVKLGQMKLINIHTQSIMVINMLEIIKAELSQYFKS